jgi:thioredoxin reductase (NADPH)
MITVRAEIGSELWERPTLDRRPAQQPDSHSSYAWCSHRHRSVRSTSSASLTPLAAAAPIVNPDHLIAFPILSAELIESLCRYGHSRSAPAGEILWSEGDRSFCFYIVLSGTVEVVEHSDGSERVVALHRPGEFTGDVDMLTGRASLVGARVVESAELLELDAEALRRVVGELPEVSEILLKAFLMRRSLLLSGGYAGLKIIGSRYSPPAHHLREFATRNSIPFTWIDLEQDQQAEELLRHFNVSPADTPIVICSGGEAISNPSVSELAQHIGLGVYVAPGEMYDLVIVGAGPAGLAAAVYASSEGLKTISIDGIAPGGQAGTSTKIENYLGFPLGISGAELAGNALLQAQKFGARISVPSEAVGLRCEGGERTVLLDDGSEIAGRCILIASGVEYKTLKIPRFEQFEGAGIYYAATEMEARMCSKEDVLIVGGGNSAGQAALFLSRTCRRVYVAIRGDDLGKSMSRYLVDRVSGTPNIVILKRHTVAALDGDEQLRTVVVRDEQSGESRPMPVRAMFMFIGAVPRTEWLRGCVELDTKGFVVTGGALPMEALQDERWGAAGRSPFFLETSLPGVFAAGDARSGSVKRVASAVGEGSMAVSFVHARIGAKV